MEYSTPACLVLPSLAKLERYWMLPGLQRLVVAYRVVLPACDITVVRTFAPSAPIIQLPVPGDCMSALENKDVPSSQSLPVAVKKLVYLAENNGAPKVVRALLLRTPAAGEIVPQQHRLNEFVTVDVTEAVRRTLGECVCLWAPTGTSMEWLGHTVPVGARCCSLLVAFLLDRLLVVRRFDVAEDGTLGVCIPTQGDLDTEYLAARSSGTTRRSHACPHRLVCSALLCCCSVACPMF